MRMENVSEPPPSCLHLLIKRLSVCGVLCGVNEAAGAEVCASSLSGAILSPLSTAVGVATGDKVDGKPSGEVPVVGGKSFMMVS